jgi:hypothetical protein
LFSACGLGAPPCAHLNAFFMRLLLAENNASVR